MVSVDNALVAILLNFHSMTAVPRYCSPLKNIIWLAHDRRHTEALRTVVPSISTWQALLAACTDISQVFATDDCNATQHVPAVSVLVRIKHSSEY